MLNNNKFNNLLIVSFEITIALIGYGVLLHYDYQFKETTLFVILVLFLLMNLFIGYYLQIRDNIFNELQEKLDAENKISNTIFNLQKAIIIIRDDVSMTKANEAFFQTFDFISMEDFSNKHNCICELFIPKENVQHLLPVVDGLNWSDYIIKYPQKRHEAYMLDKYGKERSYTVDLHQHIYHEKSMVVFTETTKIKSQAETFQKLFENSADGLLILKNNQFLDVNPTLLKIIECPSKEIFLTLSPQVLLPTFQPDGVDSNKLHQEMVNECTKSDVSTRQRLQKKLSGETFWCDIAMTKITIEQEEVIYVRWRDIDTYKCLELSLEEQVQKQSQELLAQSRLAGIGEMMENITHQWKQPLSLILNLIQLIKIELPKSRELEIIAEQTKYLDKTIADFKNFSSHSNSSKKLFNLSQSLEETLNIFKFQAEKHSIEIETNLQKDAEIKGDIGLFNQAILVLLSNSKDALLENKKGHRYIQITTKESIEKIYLTISDNGGGIPQNIINKIFEPYFTTKFKDKGTGIGLSMTYTIIKQAKGTIEVNNNKDGASFKITLPKINTIKESNND